MKKFLICLTILSAWLAGRADAASVGPTGYQADFSTRPPAADWATRSIAGGANGAADSTNAVMVDTNIAVILASSITTQVLDFSPTNPPANNALASWTSAGGAYLLTRPTGVRLTLLMATLVNNTGSNVATVNIAYTLNITTTGLEEVPGQRVYYSLTGAAGSWVNIAAPAASGPVNASINTTWLAGASLYVLIADDNGTVTPDTACQIDDFSVTTSGGTLATTAITITSPTEGQNIVEGASFTTTTITSGSITDAGFYLDGTLVGSDITAPYSVTYSNLALGAHTLTAVVNSSITSAPVHINIVANNPPSVALVTTSGANTLVGLNITNTATVTDTDPGGSIQRVEFYLDDVLRVTDTTSPFTYELCDIAAGPHVVKAIATDQSGARGTNSNSLTATNPADVTVIIPNGSSWKYLDNGTDASAGVPSWISPLFNDTGWSNGVAELGYGDSGNNRPETTVVGYGPSATTKYITTYFRKTFTVADPAAYTNLIIRLLRDDGGIIYLNGAEVLRSYMTNGAFTFTTLAGLAGAGPAVGDDGTVYQVYTNANTLVAGPNVIAVEIHQDAANSSDISFDLMLWGQGPVGPALTITPTDATHADISWLINGSAGYLLESKNDLNNAWSLATDLDVPDATRHHVNVDTSTGHRFFRLNKP